MFDKLVVASDGTETTTPVTDPAAVANDAAVEGDPDELAPPINSLLPAQLVSPVYPAHRHWRVHPSAVATVAGIYEPL